MEILNKNGTTRPLEMKIKSENVEEEIKNTREIDWDKVVWTCPRLTKSIRTIVKRVLAEFPELADMVKPERIGGDGGEITEERKCCFDFYKGVRHIMIEQEWSGRPFTMEQLRGVIKLCHNPTVRDPLRYLMTCLSKAELDRTLETLKNHTLPFDKRLYNVARRLKVSAQWQLNMWNDIIRGRYNLNDIMIACEIAEGKENPPAYFTAIFRNGKPKWLVENETY